MNRFTKKFFALLGAAAFALGAISCGNISEGDTENYTSVNDSTELVSANKARLCVSLGNEARSATILPEDVSKSDITKAELFAENDDDDALLLGEWETTDSVNAIASMESDSSLIIDVGTYTFTLKLYVTQNDEQVLCQIGTIKDRKIVAGANTLSFETEYASESTGNLSVKFNFKKEQYIEKIEVQLVPLNETDQNELAPLSEIYSYDKEKDGDEISASYARAGLENGTYILRYYIYGLEPSAREAYRIPPINTFEKLVKIASGCTTSTTISFYNEDGKSIVNSLYSLSFIFPNDVSFAMPGEDSNTLSIFCFIGESILMPGAYYFKFNKKSYKTLLGWSLSEKPKEDEELITDYISLEGDTTLYAQFYDGILITPSQLNNSFFVYELIDEVVESGDKKVPIKINGKIKLDPLGKNWKKDAYTYTGNSAPVFKYTNETFGKLAYLISELQDENISVSLDLSKTGIEYLPTTAFMPLDDSGQPSDQAVYISDLVLPESCEALLPFSLTIKQQKYTVPSHIKSLWMEAFSRYTYIVDFEDDSLCEELLVNSANANARIGISMGDGIMNFTIPAKVKSVPDFIFAGNKSLSIVKFQKGSLCESIGEEAFTGTSLRSIVIPAKVKKLKYGAFYECEDLKTVSFEDGSLCESIGEDVFDGCENIESVVIPAKVKVLQDGIFAERCNLRTVTFQKGSALTEIPAWAFYECEELTNIELPEGVKSIGKSAFSDCDRLTGVEFPKSLKSIGDEAFSDCWELTSIKLPEGLTSIGKESFYGCNKIESISLPESCTSIGEDSFDDCANLLTLSCYASNFDAALRECSGAKDDRLSVKVNGSIESGDEAESDFLASVKTTLEDADFYVNLDLAELTGLTKIPESAFDSNSLLYGISLPSSITEIGEKAFKDCYNLESLNCDTKIAANAILSCTGDCAQNSALIVRIKGEAYDGFIADVNAAISDENVCEIILDLSGVTGLKDDELSAYEPNTTTSITVPESKTEFESGEYSKYFLLNTLNCYTNNAAAAIAACTGDCASKSESGYLTVKVSGDAQEGFIKEIMAVLDSGVDSPRTCDIFLDLSEVTKLTEFSLNSDNEVGGDDEKLVISDDENLSSLVGIKIPASVTSIGKGAFYCNKKLKYVIFAKDSQLNSIGDSAFACTGIKDITLPSSLETIDEGVFWKCDELETVTFESESKLKTIGEYAFADCDSLSSFTFGGTSAQWAKVERGKNWHRDIPAKEITCTNRMVSVDYDGIFGLYLYSWELNKLKVFEGTTLKDLREAEEAGNADYPDYPDYIYIFRRPGYKLIKWEDMYGEVFDEETPICEDMKLGAYWEPIEYQITYELDGGTNSDSNPATYTVESAFKLEEPTKKGYVFIGWFDAPTDGRRITDSMDEELWYMAIELGEIKLYARWSESGTKIVVEVAANGDIGISTESSELSDNIILEASEGYTGYSWLIEGVSASKFEGASLSEDGRTLTIEKSAIPEGARYQVSLSAMKGLIPYGAQVTVKR